MATVSHLTTNSHSQYRNTTHHTTTHTRRQAFYALPQSHWTSLASPPISYLDTLSAIDDAIDANADIAEAILETALQAFNLTSSSAPSSPSQEEASGADDERISDGEGKSPNSRRPELSFDWKGTATPLDVSKARSTIHQLYRDWSAEGANERTSIYAAILDDLAAFLPAHAYSIPPEILLPGAGLSRLALHLASNDYAVTANEISYHSLFTSDYILNHVRAAGQHVLYPFVSHFGNRVHRADQLRGVKVPDVLPSDEVEHATKEGRWGSMCVRIGDFCDIFDPPRVIRPGAREQHGHDSEREERNEEYDAVVTLFFVDTAPNLLRYIETVRHVLKVGGIWCNIGPLLWHFGGDGGTNGRDEASNDRDKSSVEDTDSVKQVSEEDTAGNKWRKRAFSRIGTHGSFEPSHDEIILLLRQSGFEVLREETKNSELETRYVGDDGSMLQSLYRPVRWVARKL